MDPSVYFFLVENKRTDKQTNKQQQQKKQRQLLNCNPLSLIVVLFRPEQ